jgi:hypothetical protein
MKRPTKDTPYEIGMEVLYYNGNRHEVRKIERITDAYVGFSKEGGHLFRKDGGDLRGMGDWSSYSISIPEDGEIEKFREQEIQLKKLGLVRNFAGKVWDRKIDLEQRLRLYDVLVREGFI